jgi:hypothetical protein
MALWIGAAVISVMWVFKAHREPKEAGQETPWLPEGGKVMPHKTSYENVKGSGNADADVEGQVWSTDMDDHQHNQMPGGDTSYAGGNGTRYDDPEHDRYPLVSGAVPAGTSSTLNVGGMSSTTLHDNDYGHHNPDSDTLAGRHPGRRWDQPQPYEEDDLYDSSGAPPRDHGYASPPPAHEEELPSYSAPSALSPGGYYGADHDTAYGGAGRGAGRGAGGTLPFPDTPYGYDRNVGGR